MPPADSLLLMRRPAGDTLYRVRYDAEGALLLDPVEWYTLDLRVSPTEIERAGTPC